MKPIPPPATDNQDNIWLVDYIVGHRQLEGKEREYLIKWKDYDHNHNEWKTAEDLEGDDRGAFQVRAIKAFKAPATQAEEVAGTTKELKKGDDGSYAGALTEEGAKALLSRGGRGGGGGAPAPSGAKGTAKFWIKDGTLSKYEYQVEGMIKRRDSDEEVKINRTTTVEIKDVGTTKIEVPAEVKKKLS